MNRAEFKKLVNSQIVILDGATGTELIKRGMPSGVSPELWVSENPRTICEVQNLYREAGSHIVYAPTFGGNLCKLAEFGLESQAYELNKKLAEIAKSAAGDSLVFGDIAPTGKFLAPMGDLDFEEAVRIFRTQAEALIAGGVDGFTIETMMDTAEARAALIGVREAAPDMPVIVTMTFEESGRSLTGCDPAAALIAMQSLGADAFGCNCSTGPDTMADFIRQMKPYAKIPLVAKPNAGIPLFRDSKTVFSMSADEFAAHAPELIKAGASIAGGCCGTSPEYIAALHEAVKNLPVPEVKAAVTGAISSARKVRVLSPDRPFAVIGERINPTEKKALQESLRQGKYDMVFDFAVEQTAAGADLLDVNTGLSGIDEPSALLCAMQKAGQASDLPLSIDSTNPEAVEIALRQYCGRALLNSISAEKSRLEKILPIAAKYGAMLILLPLTDKGIPADGKGRIEVIEYLLNEVAKYGYTPDEVCVDALILTASTGSSAANDALEVLDYCRANRINSVCGLSNISYGLPARPKVNAAFLGMAIGRGLNMAIANPMNEEMMDIIRSTDLLWGRDVKMAAFLQRFGNASATEKRAAKSADPMTAVFQAVLNGDDDNIIARIDSARAAGIPPERILQEGLIAAINEVGGRFERKEYFLPQLIMSADAMRKGTEYLQEFLGTASAPKRGKIILATVKGDIHDIGKNIVGVMLRNYGFEVIDLGKDVPAETILDKAAETGTKIIGLSALMTTTIGEMAKVVELAKVRNMADLKFIAGGAVVDKVFADSIGAGYAADAMETVKIASALVK